METPPLPVTQAFERLKTEEKVTEGYLALSRIRGYWYVYRRHGKWDKANKRMKSMGEYVGKITIDGLFIRKNKPVGYNIDTAIEIIRSRGGKIIWENEEPQLQDRDKLAVDSLDAYLIRALSTNAEINLKQISKIFNVSYSTVSSRKIALEKEYKIRYIIEPHTSNLGFMTFSLFIKLGKEIDMEKVKELLNPIIEIRLVVETSGEYDLIIFFFEKYIGPARNIVVKIKELLNDPAATFFFSVSGIEYNFIPLRQQFFELLKKNIWQREKSNIKIKPDQFTHREYIVLKELSADANQSFKNIADKYNLNEADIRYTYRKLREKQIIKRITISLHKFEGAPKAAIILQPEQEEKETWPKIYDLISNEFGLIGECLAMAYTGIPFGYMFFVTNSNIENLVQLEDKIRKTFNCPSIFLTIKQILVGELCYRNLDPTNTTVYDYCVKELGTELPVKKTY